MTDITDFGHFGDCCGAVSCWGLSMRLNVSLLSRISMCTCMSNLVVQEECHGEGLISLLPPLQRSRPNGSGQVFASSAVTSMANDCTRSAHLQLDSSVRYQCLLRIGDGVCSGDA